MALLKRIKKYFLEIDTKIFTLLSSIIILIILIFIYPTAKRMLIISEKAKNLKNSIAAQQSISGLEEVNSYEKYETKLNLLNQAIIAKNRELEFITTLENIATRFHLQQKINISPREIIDNSNYAKIPLSISLQGEFQNQIKYLQDIEKLPIYINIKKININTAKEKNTAAATKMLLLADTFWQ